MNLIFKVLLISKMSVLKRVITVGSFASSAGSLFPVIVAVLNWLPPAQIYASPFAIVSVEVKAIATYFPVAAPLNSNVNSLAVLSCE